MITKSDRLVFLLGAGFSAANDLPVMSLFADKARRHFFDHQARSPVDQELLDSYDSMFTFQRECERSSAALLKDWENIEELYTQADLRRLSQLPDPDSSSVLCNHLAWVIWDVYRRGVPAPGSPSPADPLSAVVRKYLKMQGLRTTLITTNYDLIAESALTSGKLEFSYPGFRFRGGSSSGRLGFVPAAATTEEPGIVDVIKLHGSVNWFVIGNDWYCSKAIHNEPGQPCIPSTTMNKQDFLEAAQQVNGQADPRSIQPAIIPPMLGKASASSVIAIQWRAAITALSQARVVIVVGYSFPETDAFMSRLLVEGLHNNRDIEMLLIIDSGAPIDWKAKVSRLFHPIYLRKNIHFINRHATEALAELSGRRAQNVPGYTPL
jgi:NAD-dependent SIR2 family protein deacetylase